MASNSKVKGDIVEDVVARLHANSGFTVDKRVELPTIRDKTATREIDVLLSTEISGYPIQIAVECKNYKSPISVGKISEFLDKLKDVGLPSRPSVFVSTSGFQSGAKRRAAEEGVQLLDLFGLTDDRMKLQLLEAVVHNVYLIANIDEIKLTTTGKDASPVVSSEDGGFAGALQDFMWKEWLIDKSLHVLGKHVIEIKPAIDWKNWSLLGQSDIVGVSFGITVSASILRQEGTFSFAQLNDTTTGDFKKANISATFEDLKGSYKLKTIRTEDELNGLLESEKMQLSVINRIIVPRILVGDLVWPPDSETLVAMSNDFNVHREEYMSGKRRFRPQSVSDLSDILIAPDPGYLELLKSRIGSDWPEHILRPFT